eukprot:6165571-Pleurochrysis_carterae.AAC.1
MPPLPLPAERVACSAHRLRRRQSAADAAARRAQSTPHHVKGLIMFMTLTMICITCHVVKYQLSSDWVNLSLRRAKTRNSR